MNINEEGKYYASMVRKFRTEYKSKNLHGFCKDQKVSYTKMLHCLRNDSYRKPTGESVPSVGESGLHPVVETEGNAVLETSNLPVASYDDMIFDDVELSYGAKVSLHIGPMVTFISSFQRTVVEFAFTIFIILVRFLQKRSFAATILWSLSLTRRKAVTIFHGKALYTSSREQS